MSFNSPESTVFVSRLPTPGYNTYELSGKGLFESFMHPRSECARFPFRPEKASGICGESIITEIVQVVVDLLAVLADVLASGPIAATIPVESALADFAKASFGMV